MVHPGPCSPGVTCVNTGDGDYRCLDCPQGYNGTGDNCTDIDEVEILFYQYIYVPILYIPSYSISCVLFILLAVVVDFIIIFNVDVQYVC